MKQITLVLLFVAGLTIAMSSAKAAEKPRTPPPNAIQLIDLIQGDDVTKALATPGTVSTVVNLDVFYTRAMQLEDRVVVRDDKGLRVATLKSVRSSQTSEIIAIATVRGRPLCIQTVCAEAIHSMYLPSAGSVQPSLQPVVVAGVPALKKLNVVIENGQLHYANSVDLSGIYVLSEGRLFTTSRSALH